MFAEVSDSKTKHALFALQNLYSTCSLSLNVGTSHPNIAKRGTELTHIHVCILFYQLIFGYEARRGRPGHEARWGRPGYEEGLCMRLGEEGLGMRLGEGGLGMRLGEGGLGMKLGEGMRPGEEGLDMRLEKDWI